MLSLQSDQYSARCALCWRYSLLSTLLLLAAF